MPPRGNDNFLYATHRIVDRFKLRLRDVLEQTIKTKGGVSHAIIREAFLDWDADASGKLDPRELVSILDFHSFAG